MRPALRLVTHNPRPIIAMSFVHPLCRLDFDVRAIAFVVAVARCPFPGGGALLDDPHVAIRLRDAARSALYRMSCAILASDQAETPIAVWVGDRCVTRPVLRELLGTTPTFYISANSFEEAREQAAILMSRCTMPELKLVHDRNV